MSHFKANAKLSKTKIREQRQNFKLRSLKTFIWKKFIIWLLHIKDLYILYNFEVARTFNSSTVSYYNPQYTLFRLLLKEKRPLPVCQNRTWCFYYFETCYKYFSRETSTRRSDAKNLRSGFHLRPPRLRDRDLRRMSSTLQTCFTPVAGTVDRGSRSLCGLRTARDASAPHTLRLVRERRGAFFPESILNNRVTCNHLPLSLRAVLEPAAS